MDGDGPQIVETRNRSIVNQSPKFSHECKSPKYNCARFTVFWFYLNQSSTRIPRSNVLALTHGSMFYKSHKVCRLATVLALPHRSMVYVVRHRSAGARSLHTGRSARSKRKLALKKSAIFHDLREPTENFGKPLVVSPSTK